ncbi:MAG TPA: 3-hydroxyacyl-CoA dehydrogenase family protein [Thermoanaerobaculia bacterium]|nr:3-hydroxyacyl-CoA dehydrogenase family protein [Thermoanaerobaculia bacterium]
MELRQITVLGAGTMGRGIAHLAALAGYETMLYDVDLDVLRHARSGIESNMAKGVERKKLEHWEMTKSLSRLELSTDLELATRGADLIIEAVPEDPVLKQDLFSQVDLFCGEHTIFASNTSSISITTLAGAVERREKFIGMHFFNPPHIMKLVEIVLGDRTSEETLDLARGVASRMGKEAIVVRDRPGFATSRLGIALGLEAIRMLEEGVASAEDIDKAMELGYNHPMGPLRLTDLVGLDVRLSISEYLAPLLGDRFEPPHLLRRMVGEGKLGKKSGQGFYEWDSK